MAQFSTSCSVYRGGTSRGLFFHQKDLPTDTQLRNRIFLEGIDCYNLSQVNGLGGTTSSTSKVGIIAPPSQVGADVDWTFVQLGVGETVVDEKGTCGNLMAAAALLPGTIANEVAEFPPGLKERMVRIGHPEGIVEVLVTVAADGENVSRVGMERTARRIMKGTLFTPVL